MAREHHKPKKIVAKLRFIKRFRQVALLPAEPSAHHLQIPWSKDLEIFIKDYKY